MILNFLGKTKEEEYYAEQTCISPVHIELRKGAPAACFHQNWSSNVCPANVKLQEVARTE